jgi:hypothetical protein
MNSNSIIDLLKNFQVVNTANKTKQRTVESHWRDSRGYLPPLI